MVTIGKRQSVDEARKILEDNSSLIELFHRYYSNDVGIMIEVINAHVRDQFSEDTLSAEKLDDLLTKARKDITVGATKRDTAPYDPVRAAILAAPSFRFLVRHFRRLSQFEPDVMPHKLVPSDDIVEAALVLFHESQRQRISGSEPPNPAKKVEPKLLGEEGDWGVESRPIPLGTTPAELRQCMEEIAAELDKRKGLDPRA